MRYFCQVHFSTAKCDPQTTHCQVRRLSNEQQGEQPKNGNGERMRAGVQLPYHLKLLSPPSPDGQQSPESTDRDRGEGQREMAPSVPRMEWKITVAEVNVPSREPAWGD